MMQKGTIETEASAPGLTNVCLTLFYISTFYVKNVLGGMVLKSRLLRSSYYGFSPNINILERLTIWNNLGQLALEHCVFNMFYLLLYFAFFFVFLFPIKGGLEFQCNLLSMQSCAKLSKPSVEFSTAVCLRLKLMPLWPTLYMCLMCRVYD